MDHRIRGLALLVCGACLAAPEALADDDRGGDERATIGQLKRRIEDQEAELARRQAEFTRLRKAVETAMEGVKAAQAEAAARRKEVEERRGKEVEEFRRMLGELGGRADAFKRQQAELNDRIRNLERDLEAAWDRNRALRERVMDLQAALKQAGVPQDRAPLRGGTAPPEVQGTVTRVDPQRQSFVISIGSDDGLAEGHELHAYRLKPSPEYLGKVRVQSVEPDQAVVIPVGPPPRGEQIREKDMVSTKLVSRPASPSRGGAGQPPEPPGPGASASSTWY